jgi:hypothetical protein
MIAFARNIFQLVSLTCQLGFTALQVVWMSFTEPQSRRWWKKHWQDEQKKDARKWAMQGLNVYRMTWRESFYILGQRFKSVSKWLSTSRNGKGGNQ